VHGVRWLLECFTRTTAGEDVIEAEVAPMPRLKPLTVESSTRKVVGRIRTVGIQHFHAAGACTLGSVLDAGLRVKVVQGLRVMNASIFPAPVGGHLQSPLYELVSGPLQ
jgi:choline dehydrogenase-like flavoprotein